MNTNIEQSICNAISIMVEQYLNKADFARTIEANIYKCVDAKVGEYLVTYQGNHITAYATSGVFYENGARVYVLLTNNNLLKNKLIIGQAFSFDIESAITNNKILQEAVDDFVKKYLEDDTQFQAQIRKIIEEQLGDIGEQVEQNTEDIAILTEEIEKIDTKFDKTFDGTVTQVNSNNTYTVKINNKNYSNVPTNGGQCQLDEVVKIMFPQNSDMPFILKGGGGGSYLPLTGGIVTGEIAADGIDTKELFVRGAARFVDDIQGNITGQAKYAKCDSDGNTIKDTYANSLNVNGQNLQLKNKSNNILSTVTLPKSVEVENALGSKSTTNALSAYQGTVLNNKINSEIQPALNTLWSDLGGPTVFESGVIDGSLTNKIMFHNPDWILIEESSDGGETYFERTNITKEQKKSLVFEQASGSPIACPVGHDLRITFTYRDTPVYVWVNMLYLYMSTAGYNVKIKIETKRLDDDWKLFLDWTNEQSQWPGHFLIRHNSIGWHSTNPTAAQATQLRFTIRSVIPETADLTRNLILYAVSWYGGYPFSQKYIYNWDHNKNFILPGGLIPNSNGYQDMGSTAKKWNNIYANKINAKIDYSNIENAPKVAAVNSLNTENKIFLIGAPAQQENASTYSNSSVYTQNGKLNANTFILQDKFELQYNNITKSVKFMFKKGD